MSAKNIDKKNRFRNKTVAFRVSPEEWKQFEIAVGLSGLTKQDYLISRIYERDIVVQGNPRVYKLLRNQLRDVLTELKNNNQISDELLETINLITITLKGLKENV
ncbi:MAG: hypothetical protein R3Y35_09280 [Clostridia bacterium]